MCACFVCALCWNATAAARRAKLELAFEATRSRHVQLTKVLHPDLHVFKPSPSALFYACRKGNAKLIVDLIVQRRTPVNCTLADQPNVWPLHVAVKFGQAQAVQVRSARSARAVCAVRAARAVRAVSRVSCGCVVRLRVVDRLGFCGGACVAAVHASVG